MDIPEQIAFEFPQGNDLLKRLQAIEFEMAVVIKDIFERNDIRYVIEYGSLLGAVRHGGFILWDDDFDYVVFEDDYEKASIALRKELPGKYILHDQVSDPNYFYSFAKVRHLHSVAIEEGFTDNLRYQGISIDLFKGRIEKNNKYARRLFLARSHAKSHWRKFKMKKSAGECARCASYYSLACFYGILHSLTPKTDYFHKTPDTDQYFIPLERYMPFSKVSFNGVEFSAPRDPEYVLTDRYGDWRSIPKRITFHLQRLEIESD
ncbi:MAG: LicD family protein [Fibrobacter sp.]|nr:LicD family protein [Fibrobacter sp.]